METLVEKRSQRSPIEGGLLDASFFLADLASFLMTGLASVEKRRLAVGDFWGMDRGGENTAFVGVPSLLDLRHRFPFSSTAFTNAPPPSVKGAWLRVAMLWKDFLSLEGEANREKGIVVLMVLA